MDFGSVPRAAVERAVAAVAVFIGQVAWALALWSWQQLWASAAGVAAKPIELTTNRDINFNFIVVLLIVVVTPGLGNALWVRSLT
jgi:hypothetical protein